MALQMLRGLSRARQAAMVALLFAVVIGGAVLASSTRPVVPAAVGSDTADVRLLTGGIHTVHHSLRALPNAQSPRADGLPTLVWFGATWCEVCKGMEGVMASVKTDTQGRLAMVEKDVDTEPALARQFGVRGTPTFVLMDAHGRELGRLPPAYETQAFEANLEHLLARGA